MVGKIGNIVSKIGRGKIEQIGFRPTQLRDMYINSQSDVILKVITHALTCLRGCLCHKNDGHSLSHDSSWKMTS